MDWDDCRYFLAIGRAGSLAGAARLLRVQHSTVARRLEGLEASLGASLFVRMRDGLVLSDAGREILPLAEDAERAILAIGRRVAGSDSRIEGMVRLATSEAFSGFLVRHLNELRELCPALTVEVLAGNRPLDLTRGEADLAVRISAATTTQPDLIYRRIGVAHWSLYGGDAYVARRGAPASPRDLTGHDIIGFDETMGRVPGALWLGEHGRSARITLRGNSILAVLNATLVGMGLGVIPCFIGDAEATLRRLTPDVLGTGEIWLVYHPDMARVARVRRVIDFVTEVVERDGPRLRGEASVLAAGPAP